MKQIEVKIERIKSNGDFLFKKITSMHWKDGLLWLIVVDFMEDGNSNDYVGFFLNKYGDYIDANNNLKAILNNTL